MRRSWKLVVVALQSISRQGSLFASWPSNLASIVLASSAGRRPGRPAVSSPWRPSHTPAQRQALRDAARRVDRDRAGWPHDGRISHRSVDLLADRRGDSKAVQGPVPCGAFIADSPRAGLQPAKAAASGAGAGSRCGRTLAKVGLAAGQKKATRSRASIAFIDETGFRLQPVNRRTWASLALRQFSGPGTATTA